MVIAMWGLVAILAVLAIALVSGIIVGRRKKAIARQVFIHLLAGIAFLIASPFIAYGGWQIYQGQKFARVEREAAIFDAWMAPLKKPAPGELDRALASVVDAEGAATPGRRAYLILALQEPLGSIEVPLNERERTAVIAVAQRLRAENERRTQKSHPSNLDRLDGAVAWLVYKPDLAAALESCTGRSECNFAVLDHADKWCWRRIGACREGITMERLASAETVVKGDRYVVDKLGGLRRRVLYGPARP